MESINTGITLQPAAQPRATGTAQKPEAPLTLSDGFSKSVAADLPSKPVFDAGASEHRGVQASTISTTSPITLGVLGMVPEPVLMSLPGTIAKWLITDKQEIQLGEMLAEQVEMQFPLSDDPALNARVNRIGKQIAAHSKRPNLPYTFKVIDDESINAFAGPGGKVYVHKGLLDRFADDAHLAFVMGHEMGHVENRDAIDKLGVMFVLNIMQVVLKETPGKVDDVLGGAVAMLYDSRLSQKAEYAADRRGVDHMKALGHDPRKGAEALRKLESAGKENPSLLERLFSSHPPTESRAKRIEQYAA